MAKKKFKIDISPIDETTETIESEPQIEDSTISDTVKAEQTSENTAVPEPNISEEVEDQSASDENNSNNEVLDQPVEEIISINEKISNTPKEVAVQEPIPANPVVLPDLDQLTKDLYTKVQKEQQIREQAIVKTPSVLSAFRISTDISDAIEYIDKKYDTIKISELVDRLLRNSLEMFYAEDFEYAKSHPYSRDPYTGKRLNADGSQKHQKKTKKRRQTRN